MICDRVKCRLKSTKQDKEELVYVKGQSSQGTEFSSYVCTSGDTAATFTAKYAENARRNRSILKLGSSMLLSIQDKAIGQKINKDTEDPNDIIKGCRDTSQSLYPDNKEYTFFF